MPKLSIFLNFIFLSLLLFSCSGENLYEFEELSKRNDYVIQVVVVPKDPNKSINFQVIFSETDGFGETLREAVTYNSPGEYKVVRNAVKEYKKVGVSVVPNQNVAQVDIKIYEILFNGFVFWRSFEEVDGEISVYYDFETGKEEVIFD